LRLQTTKSKCEPLASAASAARWVLRDFNAKVLAKSLG
jgi:hypothetical protein